MKFRSDIEGLRAVAVIPVVIFHAWPSAVPGGFVGVDIFFVISGYLITTLLLQRLESNTYSIVAFYGARVRRIFPALFTMLIVSSIFAYQLLPPTQLKEYARTAAATALFFSNIEFYHLTDYFAGATELKPLLHTWSLAVEEQFYILFPLLLAVVYRRARRYLLPTLLLLAAVSLVASEWLIRTDPTAAFYFFPPRAFELLIGSSLAVIDSRKRAERGLREWAAAAGFAMIVFALFTFSSETPFPGLASLLPTLGAALLIWSGGGAPHEPTRCSMVLRSAPVRWVGLISYSLYLWHWPVMVFSRHLVFGELSTSQRCAAVAVSFVLAALSVRYVEAPFRKARWHDRSLLAFATACIVTVCSSALLASWKSGFSDRFEASAMSLFAAERDSNPYRQRCHGAPQRSIPYAQRCIFGGNGAMSSIAVWGDSHGAELALAVGNLMNESNGNSPDGVASITSSSCPPALRYDPPRRPLCSWHNEETARSLASDRDVHTVIMVARYAVYSPDRRVELEAGLAKSIDTLILAGKQVVLVEPIPDPGYPVPSAAGLLSSKGRNPSEFSQPLIEYENQNSEDLLMLRRLATKHGAMPYSPTRALCADRRCSTTLNGVPLYFDDNHLSVKGAKILAHDLLFRINNK